MSVLSAGSHATGEHLWKAENLFRAVGRTMVLDEKHLDAVTTPAGCTIDGLLKLEEGGLRVTLIKAVVESTVRAGQLIAES